MTSHVPSKAEGSAAAGAAAPRPSVMPIRAAQMHGKVFIRMASASIPADLRGSKIRLDTAAETRRRHTPWNR